MIWHSSPIADVLQELNVTPDVGLTEQEAAERLKEYGKNSLQEQHAFSFRSAFAQQLRAPFTILLLAIAGITLVLDLYKQILQQIPTHWDQSVLVAVLAVVGALLGALWHGYTETAKTKMHFLSAPEAKVRRDGKEQTYATHTLVPGDILPLATGDVVPADCRLVEAEGLRCDECALTGATMPTEKYADGVFDDITPLAQRTNMLYAGSIITAGHATAVVVATGVRSEMVHSAARAQHPTITLPSQSIAGKLRLWWSIGVLLLCIAALIVGLIRHEDRSAVLLTVAALATAAVPNHIGDLFTQLTMRSIKGMSRHRVRLSHPEAAETLGDVTVFCAEQETLFDNSAIRLCRAACGTASAVELSKETPNTRGIAPLMRLAVLNCSNSSPIHNAILQFANGAGIHRRELLVDMPRIGELNSCDDFHAGVHLAGEETLILVSGDWRTLMPLCIKGNLEDLSAAAHAMEADGLQVVAVTYRLTDTAPAVYTADELVRDLTCAGLLGFQISLKQDVSDAVTFLPKLRTILFSNEPTASSAAAAMQAGITSAPCVATAETAETLTEEEWPTAVEKYNVYCGLSAAQKQRVVSALQNQGHVVAVTGCRSEDAALLTAADVGFAHGFSATDVAKNAADAILLDNNYVSAIAAIWEGKQLKSQRWCAVFYLILCAVAIVGIGISGLFGWTLLHRQAILLMGLHLLLMDILPPALVYIGETVTNKK